MSDGESRSWYCATSKGHGRMVHIISARTIGRARASMGRLSDDYLFQEMFWGDMIRLLGVASPTIEAETTMAQGHLLFEYCGTVVSLEVAD